jgi:hypothetical protein
MNPRAGIKEKALAAALAGHKLGGKQRETGMRLAILLAVAAILPSAAFAAQAPVEAQRETGGYADLLALNDELQAYMFPAFTSGVVLESGARVGDSFGEEAMAAKLAGLAAYERRLAALPVASWPRSQQVDWLAVTSMLNGYRFNLEVLKPWKRDPGFYLDPLMKVAFTEVPAGGEKLARLRAELAAIPPMLSQARANLTEVAGDFADLAIHNLERSDGVNHYHPYRAVPPAGTSVKATFISGSR